MERQGGGTLDRAGIEGHIRIHTVPTLGAKCLARQDAGWCRLSPRRLLACLARSDEGTQIGNVEACRIETGNQMGSRASRIDAETAGDVAPAHLAGEFFVTPLAGTMHQATARPIRRRIREYHADQGIELRQVGPPEHDLEIDRGQFEQIGDATVCTDRSLADLPGHIQMVRARFVTQRQSGVTGALGDKRLALVAPLHGEPQWRGCLVRPMRCRDPRAQARTLRRIVKLAAPVADRKMPDGDARLAVTLTAIEQPIPTTIPALFESERGLIELHLRKHDLAAKELKNGDIDRRMARGGRGRPTGPG